MTTGPETENEKGSPALAATPTPAPQSPETNRQMQAMRVAGTFGSIHNMLEGFRATDAEGGKLIDLAQQRLGEACHWATTHVFRFGMPMLKTAPKKDTDDVAKEAPTPEEAAAALGAKPGVPTTSEPEGQVGGAANEGAPAEESAATPPAPLTAEEAAAAAGVQTAV